MVCLLELLLDLRCPGLHRLLVSPPAHENRGVLCRYNAIRSAQLLNLGLLNPTTIFLGDEHPAREDSDVLEAVPFPFPACRSRNRQDVENAAGKILSQNSHRLPLNAVGDDEQVFMTRFQKSAEERDDLSR